MSILKSFYKENTLLFTISVTLLLFLPLMINAGMFTANLIAGLIPILFLANRIKEKKFEGLKDRWFQIFLLLWVYLIIRSFFTLIPSHAFQQSIPFVQMGLWVLALQYWLLTTENAQRLFVVALTFTLIFIAFNGYIELFRGIDLFKHHYISPGTILHSFGRATGLSGKENIGAITMMTMFPGIGFLLNKPSKNSMVNILSFIAALLIILFVPLSGERNATLDMSLGLILFFMWYKPIRKKLMLIIAITMIAVFVGMYVNPSMKYRLDNSLISVSKNIFEQKKAADYGTKIYTLLMQTGWNFFTHNPIVGIGLKQFDPYCKAMPASIAVTKKLGNTCITNAQNIYLEFLSETGIIGTTLFLMIVGIWLNSFCKNFAIIRKNPIIIGALIDCLLRLWPLASTSSFFFVWDGLPFWWMAGWVFAYITYQLKQEKLT